MDKRLRTLRESWQVREEKSDEQMKQAITRIESEVKGGFVHFSPDPLTREDLQPKEQELRKTSRSVVRNWIRVA
jgi:lipoate-protein ligase A